MQQFITYDPESATMTMALDQCLENGYKVISVTPGNVDLTKYPAGVYFVVLEKQQSFHAPYQP